MISAFSRNIKDIDQRSRSRKSVCAILIETDVVETSDWLHVVPPGLFLIESCIQNVVYGVTYIIPFLRQMTSCMTCFVKWSIMDILADWRYCQINSIIIDLRV